MTTDPKIAIGRVPLGKVDVDKLLSDDFAVVMPVNSVMVVNASKDAGFCEILGKYHTTVDGQVLKWLVNTKEGGRLIPKTSGSSLVFDLLSRLQGTGRTVMLIGGSKTNNALACARISESYGVDVQGLSPMVSTSGVADDEDALLESIAQARPDVLLVAFGAPKQEFWIDRVAPQLREMGIRLIVACGGTVDMLAGTLPRCPAAIQRMGMEGLYRLAIEPKWFRVKRLWDSAMVFPVYLFQK